MTNKNYEYLFKVLDIKVWKKANSKVKLLHKYEYDRKNALNNLNIHYKKYKDVKRLFNKLQNEFNYADAKLAKFQELYAKELVIESL